MIRLKESVGEGDPVLHYVNFEYLKKTGDFNLYSRSIAINFFNVFDSFNPRCKFFI